MLDQMRTTINRNLLKYAAGRAIACSCGSIADWKSWVIVERPGGTIAGNCCATCHDAAIGDKPLPAGYTIIRHGKPAKTPRIKSEDIPQKPGKALNTWLRKTIDAAHAREDKANNCHGKPRQFPNGFCDANWPMLETTGKDGTVHVDYAGDPVFSKLQINNYIAEFCRLNHLRGACSTRYRLS